MGDLQMIDVDSGDVLDTIRLVDGRIVTDTGVGGRFFDAKRALGTAATDEQLLAAYSDWCDGSVALQPVRERRPARA